MQREVTLRIEPVYVEGARVGQRITPLWGGPTPDDVVLTGPHRRADGTLYATVQTEAEYRLQAGA